MFFQHFHVKSALHEAKDKIWEQILLNSKLIQVIIKTHHHNSCGQKKCLKILTVFLKVGNSFAVPTHIKTFHSGIHFQSF